MKKFIAIITTIILMLIVWACSDYDITNPYHPDYGDIAPLQTLTLEPQKVDHIKVIWDSDYLNSEDGYKFQVDRKVGDDDWVEQYKLFNSDTYTFVDSSAGIDQTNQYRVSVAFDEHLSTPVEATVFNEFYNPTDINLTNIDLNTVQVRWSDNSNGEDGFKIDRYSIGEWTDNFVTLDENAESWIDSTVIPNDSVQYRISAFRGGIFSAEAISPRINTQIPAPGNFKKEIINISTIKFTWIDNSTGEEGFRIEKKIALEMNWSTVATVPADSTSWTDLYAEVNEVLHYRVSAFKGTESSDAVELLQFENHFPPPTNLRLSQVDLNTIRLDWIDNSDGEEGFKIYKRDPLGDWWSGTPVTLGANVETWIDTPTDIYDTLAYRVMAHKGLTTSNWSEATMSDITFPPPTDLIMTREGLSRLKFDWTDNSIGEDSFIIDKKIDTDNWIYSYGTVGVDVETWTDSLANVDHELQYRIYAKSGSNLSNYVVSDVIDNSIPAPSNLQYEKLSLNSIRLSWIDNSMDEHGFIVDKFVDGAWTNEYAQVGRNSVIWTEISAEINKSIVYRIRAYYGTDYSDETDTGIINNMFPIPTNLTADVSGMNITLNWDDNSTGEAGFKIDRKYDGGVWDDDYAIVSSDIVTWNETVVDTGKYYYRVKGYLGADESMASEVVEGWVNSVTFIKTYGGTGSDEAEDGFQTPDGGYIITGKTSSFGAGSNDIWLLKTNSNGEEIWSKTFGSSLSDQAFSIELTTDNGFIITGFSGDAVRLIKTDSLGNEIWEKTYGRSYGNVGFSVKNTTDGGYIITGSSANPATHKNEIYLLKTDADGNMEWEIFYQNYSGAEGRDVVETEDGGFVVIGDGTNNAGTDRYIWLIKTDSNGDFLWDKIMGNSSIYEYGNSIIEISDGSLIIAGKDTDVLLYKTDSSGNLLWDKSFGGVDSDIGLSVKQTEDGGYIITGSSRSYSNGQSDVWLIKTNLDGIKQWDKTFGFSESESGRSVSLTDDGGYFIVASTNSTTSGDYDCMLIKTDENGNVDGVK